MVTDAERRLTKLIRRAITLSAMQMVAPQLLKIMRRFARTATAISIAPNEVCSDR